MAETEILQLLAQVVHAQPASDRGVDLQGFAGDATTRFRAHRPQGAHVVQTVGQLDHDDPQVVGHRQEHLAEVFGLRFPLGIELDLSQLADAVYQAGDFRAEATTELFLAVMGILDDVVQQGRLQGFVVETDVGEDASDGQRVKDVRFAALAIDAGVGFGGEIAGVAQALDLGGLQVFAGDRAQIVDAEMQIIQPLAVDSQVGKLLNDILVPQRRA